MGILIIILEKMGIICKSNYNGKKMADELENVLSSFSRGEFPKTEEI